MKLLTLCFAALLSVTLAGCQHRSQVRVDGLVDRECLIGQKPVRLEDCDFLRDPPACKRVIVKMKKQCAELSIAK